MLTKDNHSHKLNGNIIFLDIDGVFTSERVHRTIQNKSHYGVWAKFDPIAIDYFNNLYFNHNISFVICSSWRNTFETKGLKHILYSAGFQGAILSCTQNDNRVINKPKSIEQFIEDHKPKNWLVVDDECRQWDQTIFVPKKTAVKTCTFNGLDCFAMEECSNIIRSWKVSI